MIGKGEEGLNGEAAAQTWPAVTTRTWVSDDGTAVSGLLLHAAAGTLKCQQFHEADHGRAVSASSPPRR